MNCIVTGAYLVSGMPQIYLCPEKNEGWERLRKNYSAVRERIESQDADVILYFSTQWLSILGYMFQADPNPNWVHVDQNWHELGSIPYSFTTDVALTQEYAKEVKKLNYKTRLINYKGFPIDTATIVAQKLLNPENKLPAVMVSCNMYSEKEETTRLGQAAARSLETLGKKAVVVLVSNLSNRFHVTSIDSKRDVISSKKDDEWNQKMLEILAEGRLEDAAQNVREFAKQANGDQHFKGLWWLNGVLGQSNNFRGKVFGYEAVCGAGAAVAELIPTHPIKTVSLKDSLNYREETSQAEIVDGLTDFEKVSLSHDSGTEVVSVDRSSHQLYKSANDLKKELPQRPSQKFPDFEIHSATSPTPMGPYPHARRYGDLIFLAGMGPRSFGSVTIPGVTLNAFGDVESYDIKVQTKSVIENIKKVLEEAGSSLEKIIDVQVFLVDMKKDFKNFNEIYTTYFKDIRPTRTTVEVGALPTPIHVELKVIARP